MVTFFPRSYLFCYWPEEVARLVDIIHPVEMRSWGNFKMPYYNFDLVIGEECRNQGGLILEGLDVASDRAEQLASELCAVLPELKTKGCAVRVTNSENKENLSNAA